jgi:hypothetical protein
LARSEDSESECWLGAKTVRVSVAKSADSESECWLGAKTVRVSAG